MSTVIKKEDIELMKKDKETFQKCSAGLEAYAAAKDDESKKKAAIDILQNYAPEKTLHILKTDERLAPIRKKIEEGGKLAEMVDLKSFIQLAKELALPELTALMEDKPSTNGNEGSGKEETPPTNGNDGDTSGKEGNPPTDDTEDDKDEAGDSHEVYQVDMDQNVENEEDPWIRSTLSKLRSKNLY